MRRAWLFGCGLCLAACGGGQATGIEETRLAPSDDAAASEARAATPPPTAAQSEATEPAPLPEGHIRRADIRRVLANGPAGVLSMVRTEPSRTNGRFVGFQIVAFNVEPPTTIDLRVGDVLVAVNGKNIVSPDDYFRVFQELQVASELRFDLMREGRAESLVYPIDE